ncbi:class I SAM-dependent methyltransferase [Candidatus Omnitrophota bacterium]
MDLNFTGETYIPGKTPKRIEDDHLERYRFASRFVKGKYVLDIACGAGCGSRMLAEAGASSVDAVDISDDLIKYAICNYAAPSISYIQDNIYSFNPGELYDVIVCFETIEHVDDYNKALSNLYSLLKEGGVLLISSPNRLISSPKAKALGDKPVNIYHVNEFTIEELRTILEENRLKVSSREIFGQRHRIYFKNDYLRKIYEKLFKPDECFSPVISRVKMLMPKYFLIIARKIQ